MRPSSFCLYKPGGNASPANSMHAAEIIWFLHHALAQSCLGSEGMASRKERSTPYSCCIKGSSHLVHPGFALRANFLGFVEVPTRGTGTGRHAYRPHFVPPDATGRTRGARGGAVYVPAPFEGVIEARLALALGDRFCPLSRWYRCTEGILCHDK